MTQEFYDATADAKQAINLLLSLPATGKEQDWQIEFGDPDRIGEMIHIAKTHSLNYDERCALFLILIASIEQKSFVTHIDDNLLAQTRSLINEFPSERDAMTFYWIDQKGSANLDLTKRMLSS